MIKSVDSVEGSTKGFILPDIHHWNRIFRLVRDGVVWTIFIPFLVAGVAALVAVGAVAVAPIFVFRGIAESVSQICPTLLFDSWKPLQVGWTFVAPATPEHDH